LIIIAGMAREDGDALGVQSQRLAASCPVYRVVGVAEGRYRGELRMTRHAWIAAVLGLAVAGTAHAQQINDQQNTGRPKAAKTQPDTDTQALHRQSENDMQAQGIDLSALSADQIKQVQATLQQGGYYQGDVDGIPGGATKQALSRFYSDQAQLALRGQILPQAATVLGLDQSEIERVRGEDSPGDAQPSQGTQQRPQQHPQQQAGQQRQTPAQ
jgi:hypothetical protein